MRGDGTWLATGLLGLALVLGTQTPAVAWQQQPVLSVSLDDAHWAASVDHPLFDTDRRWVPGDTETVTVWVRNLSSTPAELDLALVGGTRGWSRDGVMRSITVDGRPVPAAAGSAPRLDPAQGPTRIDLTMTMPEPTGNRAQRVRRPVRLLARLTSVGSPADPAFAPGQASLPGGSVPVAGHLPGAGAPPFGVPLMFIALAVAARAALLGLRRRHALGVTP